MRNQTRSLALAALFAALTAVGAFLRIPLGALSLTLQFLFTALAGVTLGAKWGAVSQGVYVALGLVGLPIFTQGGGVGYLLQPSFGFLLGLIPAAAVIGALAGERGERRRVVPACLAGLAVLYLVGLPYMGLILNVYLGKGVPVWTVVRTGMLVYLPGDGLKIVAAAAVAPALCRAVKRA
ncbi:biotin transporter BioY [Oscillospiraceae bacterium]|nr:biotin transporter BioY [Oscillospiraceae bacterium]